MYELADTAYNIANTIGQWLGLILLVVIAVAIFFSVTQRKEG